MLTVAGRFDHGRRVEEISLAGCRSKRCRSQYVLIVLLDLSVLLLYFQINTFFCSLVFLFNLLGGWRVDLAFVSGCAVKSS